VKIDFVKMHGTGNDFIMLNGIKYNLFNYDYKELALKLCNRHFSIGGDGLILVLPSEDKSNDFKMRIFNSDGSEAEMCGNGIRCFTHFLLEEELIFKKNLKVETLAGLILPELISFEGSKSKIKVNMGKPRFRAAEIPIAIDKMPLADNSRYIKDYDLDVEGEIFQINCVSMGNPHTIIFTDEPEKHELELWGRKIERHPFFPEKTNVEFVKVLARDEIMMKVWERGAGITLACGTGAAAAVVAGIKKGFLDRESRVFVHLPGGSLEIEWQSQGVLMTGPSERVYTGSIDVFNKV